MKKYTYISIILLVFDVISFWVGIHPHVTPEYRHYFIDHSMSRDTYLKISIQNDKEHNK